MVRFFGIINMVAMIFIAAMIYAFMNYMTKENQEFEALRLAYQIDYATDAGAAAMLQTGSLDMDYANRKYLSANPDLAIDMFLTVFAVGYDMIPNQENKNLIKQYIPVASVATFDGYYVGSQRLLKNATNYPEGAINDGDWDFAFGMKMPYKYSYGGAQYALTMGMDYAWSMSGSNLSKYNGMPPTAAGAMSQPDAWNIINKSISDDMAYTISKVNEENPNWHNNFYIPSQLTSISGTNAVMGPTFMVLVQGIDFTTPRPIDGFSVSGSRIDQARMVAGYTRAGTKYYTYVDKMPGGVTIENVYTSVQDAALAGYYADQAYLQ